MGGVVTQPQICTDVPACCSLVLTSGSFGFVFNETYAATHPECYPVAIVQTCSNYTNATGLNCTNTTVRAPQVFPNLTNITDISNSINDNIAKLNAERKRNYIDIPLEISKWFASLSAIACALAVIFFFAIVIYQPVIAKRCSLRLGVLVSFTDFVYSICQAIDSNQVLEAYISF